MYDVWTIMRKEWRELSLVDGGWVAFSSVLAFVLLVGVLLPWQLGAMWVRSTWVLIFWAWMPLFLVTTITADSFAGERERHTLETLLATRLPDWTILVGKVLAAVTWVWGATLICVPVGLATVNLAYPVDRPILYDLPTALGVAAVTLLAGLFGAALGVLVSLRAASVRQAQQTLTIFVMVLFLAPILALRLLPPGWTAEVVGFLTAGDTAAVAFALGAVFLGLDAVLLLLALARFQRSRLLLG